MSQDLQALLYSRRRLGEMALSKAVATSLGLHGLAVLLILLPQKFLSPKSPKLPETKVVWVSLPGAGGQAGGVSGTEKADKTPERIRRVEEVAPARPDAGNRPITENKDNPFSEKTDSKKTKGNNPDPNARGVAPRGSPTKTPQTYSRAGAAGSGDSGGLGAGSPWPGLKASSGIDGGSGFIGDLTGNFPYVWYLQSVQARITSNWRRISGAQGKTLVYFEIRRTGAIEQLRVETPSGQPELDQSALLAIRRSDPLPRLPDSFEGDSLGVRFWFQYTGGK